MSNHSSRASDGSKLADDTGRRRKVLAGVGPMISVQRGKARDSVLSGIAAQDGGGALSSGFQRQPRVVPPVLKGEKRRFRTIKHELLLKVNMLDISGYFVGHGTRVVPAGNPLKQKAVLLRKGFSSEEIRRAYQAWNVMPTSYQ